MSSFKSRFSLVVAASTLALGACATNGAAPNTPVELASEDQKAAAERADPLTRARFWAGEYEKEPENIETARYFAKALRDIESHDRAIQVATDTLILYPTDYDMLMILGRSFLSSKKPKRAVQAFGRAIQVDASKADAFSALGLAYDKAGQHQYAQRAYERALAIEPNRTATLTNLGLSQALSGNIDAAEVALRKAADNPDADIRVRQNLALVLGLQGKFAEMKTVDDAAPEEAMKKNAEVLQRMVQGDRRVSALEPETKLSNVVPAKTKSAESEVFQTQSKKPVITPERAPVEPVETASLPEVTKPTARVVAPTKRPVAVTPPPVQVAEVKASVIKEAASKPTKPDVKGSSEASGLPFLRGSLD